MVENHPLKRCAALILSSLLTLTACSESGPPMPPVDAVVTGRDDAADAPIPVDVGGDTDRRDARADAGLDAARDVVVDRGFSDEAPVDRPDVASTDRPDVVLPEVPTDPMGVPAPGSECTGDAGIREGDPTIAPPRPILPQSVSRVTSQRPSFRWALPEGTTGARVEVCADRCCTRVLQTLETEGTTVRPTTALPPGVVYWRMFGRRAGVTGSRASYTWEFGVRRRDTPVDSSWGTIRDFTGDGYDDVLITAGSSTFYVMEGGPGGPRPPRTFALASRLPAFEVSSPGDFNGDGRLDLAYSWYATIDDSRLMALISQPSGMPREVAMDVSSVRGATLLGEGSTDWNGDGYSDLVAAASFSTDDRSRVVGSALLVYHGSPSGLSSRPQQVERLAGVVPQPLVNLLSAAEDVDVDGYGDVAISNDVFPLRAQSRYIVFGHGGGSLRARPAFPSPVDGDRMYPVDSVGDIDGDGRSEVVAQPDLGGTVFLYQGASSLEGMPFFVMEPSGGRGGRDFGNRFCGADLNGDGLADLVVGSPTSTMDLVEGTGAPFNTGRMYVYFGRRTGLSAEPIWFGRIRPTDPRDNPLGFADRLASTGDLNADGIDDVVAEDFGRGTVCVVAGAPDLTGRSVSGCISAGGAVSGVY